MRLANILVPVAGLVAAVSAWKTSSTSTVVTTSSPPPPPTSVYWTTVVTTAYTTYCPSPTTVAYKNVTYTITSATTLTITNCPCTISYTTTSCPTTTTPWSNVTYSPPPPPTTYLSGTTIITSAPTPVGPTTTKPAPVTVNAADRVGSGSNVFALAAAGLAAVLL